MSEKQSEVLLCYLYDICSNESFKIIDVSDILTTLGDEVPDITALQNAVLKLSEAGLMRVSFFDASEICFSVTAQGKRTVEDIRYKLELQRREEEERLARERREEEDRIAREKLEEDKRQAALEIQRMIEETQEKMKSMSKAEKQDAVKTLEELKKDEVYQEVIVHESETQLAEKEQEQPPQVIPVAPVNNSKLIRSVFFAALFGSAFGTLIVSLVLKFLS